MNDRIVLVAMYPFGQSPYVVPEPVDGALLFTYTFENVAWALGKHLATAYLAYSLIERVRGRGPTAKMALVALVGGVGPDLIDKPLTWVGVLEYGRSFSHSLFTTTVILAVTFVLARRVDRGELSGAFAVGYLSHILVDMFGEVFGSLPYVDTAFLFWPIVVKQPIGVARPTLPVANTTIFGTIMICAAVLWVFDGMVGVPDAVRVAREWLTSSLE